MQIGETTVPASSGARISEIVESSVLGPAEEVGHTIAVEIDDGRADVVEDGGTLDRIGMNVVWQCPPDAVAALVLAHGAGAGMTHRSMESIALAFGRRGIATLRFNFPFIDAGKSRVDSQEIATSSIAQAFKEATSRTSLPIWLGGHSFGGRMASHAVLDHGLDPVGLVFCSFPLHPPGRPSVARAAHLRSLHMPMLFLSGTRDEFTEGELLEQVVADLPMAQLHRLDTGDHGYTVLKRSRKSTEDIFDEMARVAQDFVDRHLNS